MSAQSDRRFYLYLAVASAFLLLLWGAVAWQRASKSLPPAPPPVVAKIPDRLPPPAHQTAPSPSDQGAEINTPTTPPVLTTDAGETLDLRPSVEPPAEAAPAPPSPEPEAADAEAAPTAPAAAEQPAAPVDRAGRDGHRRRRHHGQRRLFHHWPGHHHAIPGQSGCEPLCEFFKGTARGAGLIK